MVAEVRISVFQTVSVLFSCGVCAEEEAVGINKSRAVLNLNFIGANMIDSLNSVSRLCLQNGW